MLTQIVELVSQKHTHGNRVSGKIRGVQTREFAMSKHNNRGQRMIENKELGSGVFAWFQSHLPFLSSGAMAASIAFARIAYEYSSGKRKRTWGASFAESVLCGLIALSLVYGMEMFGLPQSAATFIGAMIGFIGVDKVREWLENWGNSKYPDKDDGKTDHETPQ